MINGDVGNGDGGWLLWGPVVPARFLVTPPGHSLSGQGGQADEEALVAGTRACRQR